MVTIYLVAHTCDMKNSVHKVKYTHSNVKVSQVDLIAPSVELPLSSQILTKHVNIVRPAFVNCKTLNPLPPPLSAAAFCVSCNAQSKNWLLF